MEPALFNLWLVVIGGLLLGIGLIGSILKRLPLTTAFLYLLVGFFLGPSGVGLLGVDPLENSAFVERVAEFAVLFSLFTTGLKMRLPFSDSRWRLPTNLALISMIITIGLVGVVGVLGLGLSLGAAILLGAILAPTDPVLASDVQLTNPDDRDRLRFGLTGEAGLNDGTAFPFVMLGLGFLGLHELGAYGWRWLAIDVIWSLSGGLGIGWLLGTIIGWLVVYLRREHREAVGLDDFLSLGLVFLAYGAALLAQTYGFLSVFAAGLALRHMERRASENQPREEPVSINTLKADDAAEHSEKAAAYMVSEVLDFNEKLERISELAVVLLLGGMMSAGYWTIDAWWFAALLFFVIRPVAVTLGLIRSGVDTWQRYLISWFGIRGVGSIYYLMYAIQHGVSGEIAHRLVSLAFSVVAISIVVHGISVTPIMDRYKEKHA